MDIEPVIKSGQEPQLFDPLWNFPENCDNIIVQARADPADRAAAPRGGFKE